MSCSLHTCPITLGDLVIFSPFWLSLLHFHLPDPDRSLKPYSLVRPVVVQTPRPVVLSPNCIAPRLIRNLLDLPTSRLDFHVCPAGRQQRGVHVFLGKAQGVPSRS